MAFSYWPLAPSGGGGGAGGTMFGGLFGPAINANTTHYFAFDSSGGGTSLPDPTNQNVSPCSLTGTIQKFYIVLAAAQDPNGSLVVTINKNGVDTAVSITIPANGAPGIYSDLVHTVPVAAGDYLSIKVKNNSLTGIAGTLDNFSFLVA